MPTKEHNARIPAGEGEVVEEAYYVINTFVDPEDGYRVVGPVTAGQVESLRKTYEQLLERCGAERGECPFIVYKLVRVEGEYKQAEPPELITEAGKL